MKTIINQIKQNTVTVLVTTFVAIITTFSDKIIGDIKFAVNRADLKTSSVAGSAYEKITSNLSEFINDAEDVTEYYDNGWTTKSSLEVVVPPYNNAIVTMRRQEYIMLASIHRFWNKDDMQRFEEIMGTVKEIDHQLHSLNSEAEAIVNGQKLTADPRITKPVVSRLKSLNQELETKIKNFFTQLE